MMSTLYVPDATKWIQYYKDIVQKSLNPDKRCNLNHESIRQTTEIESPIRINISSEKPPSPEKAHITVVSPVEQTVDQAKSEIDRKSASPDSMIEAMNFKDKLKKNASQKSKVSLRKRVCKRTTTPPPVRYFNSQQPVRRKQSKEKKGRKNKKKTTKKHLADIFN